MKLTRRGLFGMTLSALAAPLVAKSVSPTKASPAIAWLESCDSPTLGQWKPGTEGQYVRARVVVSGPQPAMDGLIWWSR